MRGLFHYPNCHCCSDGLASFPDRGNELLSSFIKHCTGVILAGGENTRMPVLKAFIKVGNRSIIERSLDTYRQLFIDTTIVTNQPEHYSQFGITMLGDIHDIRGPMTGIFTSLMNSSEPWVFVSVVPLYKGSPEPLHAFYSTRLTTSMETALLSGKRALKDFLRTKKVNYLPVTDMKKFDPEVRSLINLNTPQDIKDYIRS